MKSTKFRIFYLMIVIIFLVLAGFLWLDYIGMIDLRKYKEDYFPSKPNLSIEAKDDEPSLLKWEELKKVQDKIEEEKEKLAILKIKIEEKEKKVENMEEKILEREKGLALQVAKFRDEKKKYESYKKNIADLAGKIGNMPPEGAVKIMSSWDDILVIDVLRRMDALAEERGQPSITSYLLFLIQQANPERAGNIMRKMAQSAPEEL